MSTTTEKSELTEWQVGPYQLRPHQSQAVNGLRQAIRRQLAAGRQPRVILQGICSFGKTIVSSYIMQKSVNLGRKAAFIAHGRVLIFQKSETLSECEITHTVMMSDASKYIEPAFASRYDPQGVSDVTVISKDTYESLLSKGAVNPLDIDLLVVDEAHTALSKSWVKILKMNPNAVIIGLTATPALGDGRGLGSFYNDMVVSTSHSELIKGGFIVPCRYFNPWSVNTRGLDVNPNNGEYNQVQVGERFGKSDLVGDFVEEWHRIHRELGEGYRQTAFYASSVAHSVQQAKLFSEGDGTLLCPGVPFEHVDSDTPQNERLRMYKALAKGDIQGICNYAVLRIGFNCPAISCIQIGVAMNSLVAYLQSVGRGFRTFPGKKDCVVFDHGGNINRHGWTQADRPWALDERTTVQSREETGRRDTPKERTCAKCGAVFSVTRKECPECGHQKARMGELIRTSKGKLKEVMPPKEKKERIVGEGQRLWDRLYWPSSKSKRQHSSNFWQLRARFHNKHGDRFYIDASGKTTRIVDKVTGQRMVLGNVPKPGDANWEFEVRNAERRDLQYAEQLSNGTN